MVVVIEIGTTSYAQRGLPIHKIPDQTATRKACSYKFRQPVTTKAMAWETNVSNHHYVVTFTGCALLSCQAVNIVNWNNYIYYFILFEGYSTIHVNGIKQ